MRKIVYIFSLWIVMGQAHAELHVFACEPEWAALTQELAQDKVEIYTATTAFQDPHQIEARPSLIAKMRKADLLVCTGADLEIGWLPLLLRQSANDKLQPGQPAYFEAAQQVERLDVPTQVDRSMGDVHPEGNPHVQLDPRRIASIADKLSARLAQVDPANATYYRQRHAEFAQRWQQAIQRWQAMAVPLKGLPVAVYHQDFVYLFQWLGIKQVVALEPKPGIPPSAGYLAEVKEKLVQQPVKLVLYTAYQSEQAPNWLGHAANIPVVQLPFTVGGSDQARDLFGLFDDTINKLLQGVKS